MEFNISSLLPDISIAELRPKIKSQRAYCISLFVDRLNKERGYLKPLSAGFIAFRMSHMDIEDLYSFYKKCEDASCGFSPCWWSELKTDKESVDRRLAWKNKYKYN